MLMLGFAILMVGYPASPATRLARLRLPGKRGDRKTDSFRPGEALLGEFPRVKVVSQVG